MFIKIKKKHLYNNVANLRTFSSSFTSKNLQYQQRNNFGGYVAEWQMCALYKIYKRLQLLQDIKLLSRQSLSYVPGVMGQNTIWMHSFPHFITWWNWHQDISLYSMRQSETQNNNILHGFYPFIPCKCGGRNNISFWHMTTRGTLST